MVRDLKYIIKRILIGVGISLLLMLIKGNLLLKAEAYTIALFDSQYNIMGYCNNCTDLQPNNSSKLATANRFVITFDGINIGTNQTYDTDVSFQISGVNQTVFTNRTLYILRQNNNYQQTPINPNLSIANYANTLLPSNPPVAGVITQANYTGTFTSDTAGLLRLDVEFQSQDISYIKILNSSINYTGTDNSEAIANSTQNITNNQNQNTTNIINNNNQNTQEIINNQNAIAQQQEENQRSCKILDKNNVVENGYLNQNGTIATNAANVGISDFINISEKYSLKVLNHTSGNVRGCFYTSSKSYISCFVNSSLTDGQMITIPSNARYFRFTSNYTSNLPIYELCTNGNQALEDTLTDESGVADSDISDLFGDLQESNSPISDLLTLPITLLEAYLTGFDSTCSSYNLGSLYGTNLVLPCINIPDYIGSSLWSVIDALCCIYMIYNIAMLFVSVYETFTSLDDSMQFLYSPQHTGHTRVSRNEGEY